MDRVQLYATASYQIGDALYSLNDIENGLLRANRPSAVPMTRPPFHGRDDPRRKFMIKQVDPRIHFTLNCGARSCPAIGVYEPEQLEAQLRQATQGFLLQSVSFNCETKTANLSMIFKWYNIDFGNNDQELLVWIKTHGSEPFQKKFQECEDAAGGIKNMIVKFNDYDWGLNSA